MDATRPSLAQAVQQQVGYLSGQRRHLCSSCDYPVIDYGRLWPCLHAFCMGCVSDMDSCKLCRCAISRVERIPAQQLYISAATLQAFKSEVELVEHAQHAGQHLRHQCTF